MNMTELKEKAEELGVKPGRKKKADLIRAIQEAEGNEPCFGKNNDGHCEYSDCCFWSDCIVGDTLKV